MANLVELFDNIVQMQALTGVPLANGKLYVYALGRTRLMDTWSDVDGVTVLRPAIKGQKVGSGPVPRNLHPFPQIIGIIFPFTSL